MFHHRAPTRPRRALTGPTLVAAIALVAVSPLSTGARSAGAAGPATATLAPRESAPAGDLPGWTQTFRDDFTTNVALGSFPSAVSSKWSAYPSPWKDTSGYGTYSPGRTVSISNGVLNQYIHTENGVPLVSALLPQVPGTGSGGGQLYGRYAIRFRADKLSGYKMAWMLWPDSNNQSDGEIDFPEKNIDSGNVWGFVHHKGATSGSDQDWSKAAIDITQWHTAVMEWSPGKVVFLLDGQQIGGSVDRVPDTPMHWVLQTETALNSGKPSSTVKGNVQIDWVAAWAYKPTAVGDTTGPVAALTGISEGATVSGVVAVKASATDASGITQVKWYLDGQEIGNDGTSPWSAMWNSQEVGNGSHRLFAKARDGAGNWGSSAAVTVVVKN